MDSSQEIKSLKKALRALTFMNQQGDATVSEVARSIGVPRTTAHRILETLASEGYVEKLPYSDYYRLTGRVERLAAGYQEELLLLEVAKPLIARAGEELGWPLCLAMPRRTDMVVRVNTDHDCARALERYIIGFATPILHATTGYCYLAHCSDEERIELLAVALQEARERNVGIQDEREVQYLIANVRNRGYCNIEFRQYREGNVGVPLLISGRAVGGLVMRYIKSVLKNTGQVQGVYVPRLKQLAEDIRSEYMATAAQRHASRPFEPHQ